MEKHCCCSSHKNEEKSCCSSSHNHEEAQESTCSCCGVSKKSTSCCGNSHEGGLSEVSKLVIAFFSLILSFLISYNHWQFIGFPITDPAWIAVFLCGMPILKGAISNLKEGRITSSLLMSVAMFAAISLQFLSYFGEEMGGMHEHSSYIFAAGEIAFLIGIGELIEEFTVAKTKEGLKRLVKMSPKKALRKNGEIFEEIDVSQIEIGDEILVRQDEMISSDGEIVSGNCAVDQSSLTGESAPVEKGVGDLVLAGTWNKKGVILLKATKKASETSIARLINLVREAEGKKAPISRAANRWASYIVPSAIFISFCVFFVARFALLCDAPTSLIRAVTILVVFCPCAFALATPTAVAAAIGNLSKKGVLVKSGAALEEMSKVDSVFFDKTGTLTSAKLRVEKVFASPEFSESEVLKMSAAAEKFSKHPIAVAIVAEAEILGYQIPDVQDCVSLAGIGVRCILNGDKLEIVSEKNLSTSLLSDASKDFVSKAKESGATLSFLLKNETLAGIISLSDEVKSEAKSTISQLKNLGVKTTILSGDNLEAVNKIALNLNLDESYAQLMPDDKLSIINKAKSEGKTTMMVGDGVNDAPALATSNVSVAMGALGSDVAIDSADCSVLNDDISQIPTMLKFSKKMMFTIKSNMIFSLCLNALAVVLGTFGIVGPVGGALLHNLSSVIVVSNSASLLFRRLRK